MTTKQTWFGIEYEYKTKWGVTKWWIKKKKARNNGKRTIKKS